MKSFPVSPRHFFFYFSAIGFAAALLYVGAGGSFAGNSDTHAVRQWKHDITRDELLCDDGLCETGSVVFPFPANTIAIQAEIFDGLRLRIQEDDGWSVWKELEGESDVPDGESDSRPYALVFTNTVRAIQIQTSARNSLISVTALKVPQSVKQENGRVRMAVEQSMPIPQIATITPRTQWLDAGIQLVQAKEDALWAKEYVQDKKFIIHHTATVIRDMNSDGALTSDDYREAVRAIYSYHTYSRSWGDIGYNYIIDPDGTIWEGRAGGDGVVAGHARRGALCTKFGVANIGFNDGTIGIALLGMYDTQGISIPAYDALVRLVAQKSWELNVDPAGSGFYKDKVYANVLGHRDVDCTDCPGATVTAGLSDITRAAKERYDRLAGEYPRRIAGQLVDMTPAFLEMQSGEQQDITLRFRNTGTVAWRNYGQEKLSLAHSGITRHIAAIDSVHIASIDDNEKDAMTLGESTRPKDYFVAGLATPNVSPGQIGTFVFRIADAPSEYHSMQKFVLAVGESGWLAGSDVAIPVTNTALEYAGQGIGDFHITIPDSEHTRASIQFINRGTKTWARGDIVLHMTGVDGGEYAVKDPSWKSKEGKFVFNEKSVAPGEMATFTPLFFSGAIGDVLGTVALYHGGEKISGSDEHQLVITITPSYMVEVSENKIPGIIQNTWRPTVSIRLKNTGTKELKDAQLFAYAQDGKSASAFYDSSWKSKKVIGTISLKSGKTATVLFKIKSPKKAGTYDFIFGIKAGKRDVYSVGTNGLTKELKQSIRVDEVKKVLKKKTK